MVDGEVDDIKKVMSSASKKFPQRRSKPVVSLTFLICIVCLFLIFFVKTNLIGYKFTKIHDTYLGSWIC